MAMIETVTVAAEGPTRIPANGRVYVPDVDMTVSEMPASGLTSAQQAEVLELLRVAFNGGPGWFSLPVAPADHLQWKLLDFPHHVTAYVMEHQDRIIGFAARPHRHWLVRGQHRVGLDGVELALHPDFQGRGLLSSRRSVVFEGDQSDFSLSFSSHPSSLHSRAARGGRPVANTLDNLVRPLNVWRYVKPRAAVDARSRTRMAIEARSQGRPRPLMVRRMGWWARMLRSKMQHPVTRTGKPTWTIRAIDRFDDRIERFFEQAATSFDLIQIRDAQFLNWRYVDGRGGPFTVRVAEEGGQILGYAVIRASDTVADIADLLALPGRLDVVHSLVDDAVQIARAAKAPALKTWMVQSHPYHELLRRHLFLPVRNIVSPGYTVNKIAPSEIEFLDEPGARIHLMIGDSDHI